MEHSQWQSLLKLGNDCFHDNNWSQAEFFYSEAYDMLANEYRKNPLSSDVLNGLGLHMPQLVVFI